MSSIDEILERFEITEMLNRYANAIDQGLWDVLDTIFTPDAPIDYTAMGGVALPFPEMKAWLQKTIAGVPGRMHLLSNIMVTLNADGSASSTAYLFNAMAFSPEMTMLIGGKYCDDLVKTPEGWRISKRRLEMVWKT